jgi:hypothetical protein
VNNWFATQGVLNGKVSNRNQTSKGMWNWSVLVESLQEASIGLCNSKNQPLLEMMASTQAPLANITHKHNTPYYYAIHCMSEDMQLKATILATTKSKAHRHRDSAESSTLDFSCLWKVHNLYLVLDGTTQIMGQPPPRTWNRT